MEGTWNLPLPQGMKDALLFAEGFIGAAQRGQDPNASYADKVAYRAQQTGKALWDKVTHMDAYDAGGLTFEVGVFLSAQQL